jgi:YVTN family beta-propeller protein
VANEVNGTVTVINGATNATTTVSVGSGPEAMAVNPVTNMIYVLNQDSGTVTVINGASNATATVAVGSDPYAAAVNPITNMIYVANLGGTVTAINGATNATATINTGTAPISVAVNPITNMIYVANLSSNNVTAINGATNATTTLAAGTEPYAVAVNPVTNAIYVANGESNNVTVIDGATYSVQTAPTGQGTGSVAVNPATNLIYAANNQSNTVSVINGATGWTENEIAVGTGPDALAVNPVTNIIYVANSSSNNVTVINGETNATSTVSAGNGPYAVAVNPVTNMIYVANFNSDNVTVINGATNATVTIAAGSSPEAVAVNPVTNMIYVPNCGPWCTGGSGPSNLTVINGATNTVTATVGVGFLPTAIAVNSATNMIYTGDGGDNTVTVINGATNTAEILNLESTPFSIAVNPITNMIYAPDINSETVTVINGTTNATSSVVVGALPFGVAVNPVTNTIYAINCGSGCTNTPGLTTNVTAINGATNTATTISLPNAVAIVSAVINPVTNTLYVPDNGGGSVHEITEQQVQENPFLTTIDALPGNLTESTTPTFDLEAISNFYPIAPTPQAVWFQLDTWQGPWLQASGTAPYFTLTAPPLSLGTHILYAYATDGQDANSTGVAQQFIGGMAAYVFTVTRAGTTIALASAPNPSNLGQSVSFTATVTVNPPGSGTPTGTVTFFARNNLLGEVTLPASGEAVYTTSALAVGASNISASYSGDANFMGSNSLTLTQQVNAPALTVTPASLSYGNQAIDETSTARTVTVTNEGTGSVTINSITVSANFAISSKTCGTTLAKGAKCQVSVTFTPAVLGKLTGTLSITDNASISPLTVALSGAGIVPAALTPTTDTYAAQTVGTTSAAKTFTLINNQLVALTGIAISTTGDFAVSTTTCTTSVAAKGRCTISVTFTPTQTGTVTGQLSVSDSASNSPQTSTLKGTGK